MRTGALVGTAFAALAVICAPPSAKAGTEQTAGDCAAQLLRGLSDVRGDRGWLATAEDGASTTAHCIVRGTIEPRTGQDGRPYGVGFELRLPLHWNGRFLFQGGGGLDGSVQPALGRLPVAGARARPGALERGYAVVSMDGGHQGDGADFAADPQAWADFAFASSTKVTRVAKAVIERFYGREISYSYFMGCSNGGREAMLAAQNLPEAFDGVIAGAPAFNIAWSALEEVWETALLLEAAPLGEGGESILALALTDDDIATVVAWALEACDTGDGLADGRIEDHRCRPDPDTLACAEGEAQICLTADKAALVRRLFGGARGPAGERLYASWPFDAGIASPAWRRQKLGTALTGSPNSGNATRGAEAFYRFLLRRPIPAGFGSPADVADLAAEVHQPAAQANVGEGTLETFARRGGKLLLFQGMSDPVFSAHDLMAWVDRTKATADANQEPWNALYLVSGMGHCGGGPALDDFDPLTAMEEWVEQDLFPDRILASGAAFPDTVRPLCPYPRVATYDGSGPAGLATSFRCRSGRSGDQP